MAAPDAMTMAALGGMRAAIDRLHLLTFVAQADVSSSHGERSSPFVPCAEALWWATTLDDHLDSVDPQYAAQRDANISGELMLGLRFVRGRVGHDLVEFAQFEPTHHTRAFCWVSVGDLPTSSGREECDDRGRRSYLARLQHRSTHDTLDRAYDWLRRSAYRPWQ